MFYNFFVLNLAKQTPTEEDADEKWTIELTLFNRLLVQEPKR